MRIEISGRVDGDNIEFGAAVPSRCVLEFALAQSPMG
jgi:hypothetical protein